MKWHNKMNPGTEDEYTEFKKAALDDKKALDPDAPICLFTGKSVGEIPWEQRLTEETLADLDEDCLEDYVKRAIQSGRIPRQSYSPEEILHRLGLFKEGHLNNAGRVLFSAKDPLVLKEAVFATDSRLTFLDLKEKKGNLFDLMEDGISYISSHMNWKVRFTGAIERVEIPEIPTAAIREAVINSFIHSSFDPSLENEIAIHPGKIIVTNAGSFPENLTPEDFAFHGHPPVLRNPILANALYLSKDIEKWGTGFQRIYEECEKASVDVGYEIRPRFFSFFFRRKPMEVSVSEESKGFTEKRTADQVNEIEEEILYLLGREKTLTIEELALKTRKSPRTIARALKALEDKKRLLRKGAKKKGFYQVMKNG
jgi:ATP-dependent DNA helicase RecG